MVFAFSINLACLHTQALQHTRVSACVESIVCTKAKVFISRLLLLRERRTLLAFPFAWTAHTFVAVVSIKTLDASISETVKLYIKLHRCGESAPCATDPTQELCIICESPEEPVVWDTHTHSLWILSSEAPCRCPLKVFPANLGSSVWFRGWDKNTK